MRAGRGRSKLHGRGHDACRHRRLPFRVVGGGVMAAPHRHVELGGVVEDTLRAIAGPAIQRRTRRSAGGGHAPDIITGGFRS